MLFPRTSTKAWLSRWAILAAAVWFVFGTSLGRTEEPPDSGKCVIVELFAKDDCLRCDEAAKFLDDLRQRHARLRPIVWNLDHDPRAVARLRQIGKAFQVENPETPSFYLFRRLISGFESAETTGRSVEDLFTIDVYWREGCPRCSNGKRYLKTLLAKYPVFQVNYYEVSRELEARKRYEDASRHFGVKAPAVPTFIIGGQIVVGYLDDATTGRRLEELMTGGLGTCGSPPKRQSDNRTAVATFCSLPITRPSIRATSSNSTPTGAPLAVDDPPEIEPFDLPPAEPLSVSQDAEEGVSLPFFGRLKVSDIGLPAFTLAIGLADGFNPCAMWVLLFLLSILVNLRDRRKIAVVAGTFVMISGLVYLVFMAAWLNVFLLIGYMRPAQIALGLLAVIVGLINVKDFFAFQWGVTLSIPESAKPGIYARVRGIVNARYLSVAIIGAMVLAVFVNAIELLCSAGFPAMYTEILSLQQLPAWQNYAYLLLYIGAYMFDDTIMLLIVVITLTKTKLQETGGRWLKLVSGSVILLLGLTMLLKPDWLA